MDAMTKPPAFTVPAALREVVARHGGLSLVVLFGSRAQQRGSDRSDWDLGFLAEGPVDRDQLLADISVALGTDAVDLVDLARAGGLVRFRAARDAVLVHKAAAGVFERFWLEAVRFWCDAEAMLTRAYDGVLADL